MNFNINRFIVIVYLYLYSVSAEINSLEFSKTGKIWHITDIHYDWNYRSTGDPNNMCHNNNLNSINNNKVGNISPLGNYRCDSPIDLVDSAFQTMVSIEPNPDFIIWTGDDPPHVQQSQLSPTLVLESIRNITAYISNYFPGIKIYPAIGNHDIYPQHQMTPGPNWLLNNLTEIWSELLEPKSLETIQKGGYYSEVISPGLRIISLNTVFYYTQDNQTVNETDPADQMAWLAKTLKHAKSKDEKVYIIGHVPPGFNEKYIIPNFYSQFNDRYLQVFAGYSDQIVAHIYGHEHSDAFRLYYDDPTSIGKNPPNGVMFITPSLTPWKNPFLNTTPNNPSLRLYYYDRNSYALNDYQQFWSNLSQSIADGAYTWKLEYLASDFFSSVGDAGALTPSAMYQSYQSIYSNPSMLDQYYIYNSVNYKEERCSANKTCSNIQLCSILNAYTQSFIDCLSS